jgi:predicted ribosomally synthesized peptide with SipW-like signal peptide
MKKLLFAIMAIVLCVGLIGGAFAYFTDTQASSANTFSAGNIKLAMSGDFTNWSITNTAVIGSAANMAPGHQVGPFYAYFKNQGSIGGVITAKISYPVGAVYDAYAKELDVTSVAAYEGGVWVPSVQVAEYWAEQICNTYGVDFATAASYQWVAADPNTGDGNTFGYVPTIYGLSLVTLHFTNGYYYQAPWNDLTLTPGAAEGDSMNIMLDPLAGNAFQGASMNITVTGTLTSN